MLRKFNTKLTHDTINADHYKATLYLNFRVSCKRSNGEDLSFTKHGYSEREH